MPRQTVASYPMRIAIAVTQLANALLGGAPDEPLSSRAWRYRDQRGWGSLRRVIDALFVFDPQHCMTSYEAWCDRMDAAGKRATG